MQKKSTNRQQPAATDRDKQDMPKLEINNTRTTQNSMHSIKSSDQKERNDFGTGKEQSQRRGDAKQEDDHGNERLKAFQKNRRTGWRDIL